MFNLIDVEKVLLYTIAKSGFEPEEIDTVVKTGGKDVITYFPMSVSKSLTVT